MQADPWDVLDAAVSRAEGGARAFAREAAVSLAVAAAASAAATAAADTATRGVAAAEAREQHRLVVARRAESDGTCAHAMAH